MGNSSSRIFLFSIGQQQSPRATGGAGSGFYLAEARYPV